MNLHRVSINGQPPVNVEAGTKLVLAIEKAGQDISHRCGGNARCTTCRVKIEGNQPPMGDVEKQCLEEDGVLGEFRLSCQIRVQQDLDVAVLMPSKEKGWDPGPEVEP